MQFTGQEAPFLFLGVQCFALRRTAPAQQLGVISVDLGTIERIRQHLRSVLYCVADRFRPVMFAIQRRQR